MIDRVHLRVPEDAGGEEGDRERGPRLSEAHAAEGGAGEGRVVGRHHEGRRQQDNARGECQARLSISTSFDVNYIREYEKIEEVADREHRATIFCSTFPSRCWHLMDAKGHSVAIEGCSLRGDEKVYFFRYF